MIGSGGRARLQGSRDQDDRGRSPGHIRRPCSGDSKRHGHLSRRSDLGLEIKAGLHTGEIEVRGEDIGGIAVHIAARVMTTASPGEVRISRTVKDLVAGSGIEFENRGAHELKGIQGEWTIFSVRTA
jgi:class 3 adenylate cyclase